MSDLSDESIAAAKTKKHHNTTPPNPRGDSLQNSLSKSSVGDAIAQKPPASIESNSVPTDGSVTIKLKPETPGLLQTITRWISGQKIKHDPNFKEERHPNCWDAVNDLPPRPNQNKQSCLRGPDRSRQ